MGIDVRDWLRLQRDVLRSYEERDYEAAIEEVVSYPDSLEQAIARLHVANMNIWDYEDEARVILRGGAQLVRERQEINRGRSQSVEEIDRLLFPESPAGEYVTESPGMILDRLSILQIKQAWGRGDFAAQISDLSEGLNRLLADIQTGRKQYRIYPNPKFYADEKK